MSIENLSPYTLSSVLTIGGRLLESQGVIPFSAELSLFAAGEFLRSAAAANRVNDIYSGKNKDVFDILLTPLTIHTAITRLDMGVGSLRIIPGLISEERLSGR